MNQQLQQLVEAQVALEPLHQQQIPVIQVQNVKQNSVIYAEVTGRYIRRQQQETHGTEQVLGIRELVPGDTSAHPISRRAYYIYQDGWHDNGRFLPKMIFDMEDIGLRRFSAFELSEVIKDYGYISGILEDISSACFKLRRTPRQHQLPQKEYIQIFESIVKIGAVIASQKYIGMNDWRFHAPESREVLELYRGQFQGEIPELFASRPQIEEYLQYAIQLNNRMQLIPFSSRCRGLMDDSDWLPGYQCLGEQMGFRATRINVLREQHREADRQSWPDSIVGTATYIQSMGLHPSIVQSVMVWITIILCSNQTRTYRDILQMFMFPTPNAQMQEGQDYPAGELTDAVNFEPPYGVHMLFSMAIRGVMLCGLNAQTRGGYLDIDFPQSDHLWGMQSMQSAHTVIKNFAVNFGSMFAMTISNLPFIEMFTTYKRMQALSVHRKGVFITLRALVFLQIVGDPTRFVWTQYVFTVFDIPWGVTAHQLQQIIENMLKSEYREKSDQILRKRQQQQWSNSDPMEKTNKEIETIRQLARALRRMEWLLSIEVIDAIPEVLSLSVVDKHIQQWTMSYSDDIYYNYEYRQGIVFQTPIPDISISEFYEQQQRYILRELWRNQRNLNRQPATDLVPADWIPRAKNTRSLAELSQQDSIFTLMQNTLPNLTCLQHVLVFLINAIEIGLHENMNCLAVIERLHDLRNPLKIIKEPQDGEYIVFLRIIHIETRNITRRTFKSKNAEYHYRLITVIIAHMDCFIVSERDSDDITSRIDAMRKQEICKPAELTDDSSILIFYDCETTCGDNVTCEPYLIAYAIYECKKGVYQSAERQQSDYPAELIQGADCFAQFLDFLVSFALQHSKKNIKLIAYNGSRFDHLFLLKSIFERDLTTDLLIGGTTTNIKFVKMSNVTIQDMQMMVGGGSLNNACRVLLGAGFQKHDCEEILQIHSLLDWDSLDGPVQQKIQLYCCQDVLLLFSLYIKLGEYLSQIASQLKQVEITIKPEHSIAASAYKIIMASITPPKPIDNLKIYQAVRSSYFGGHTEIYDLRKHDVWKWDWNSAYPFVMANSIFPMSFDRIIEFPNTLLQNIADVNQYRIMQCKLYRVKSFRFLQGWPMFQVRYKDKIVLPLQHKGELWLWGCTILWAFAVTKLELEYDAVIYSNESGEPFTFLDSIYRLRLAAKESGNDGLAQVYKLFMNSAYGQMGMKNYPSKIYLTHNQLNVTQDSHDGWLYDYCNHKKTPLQVKRIRHIDELSAVEVTFDENELPEKVKCRQIYIASLITAKCRALLLALAYSIRNTLVYCDTDSLMSQSPNLPVVPKLCEIFPHIENDAYANYVFSIGNNLGQWKFEDCTNRKPLVGFQAFAKKVYTMQKSVKIKGLRGQEATEATKKLQDIQDGAEIIWKQTQWSRKPGQIRQQNVQKTLEFTYNRIIRPDGTTSPLPTAADLNIQSIFRDSNGIYLYK